MLLFIIYLKEKDKEIYRRNYLSDTVKNTSNRLYNQEKNKHYDSIKKYFTNDDTSDEKTARIFKIDVKQRKIYDLTLSLVKEIRKQDPTIKKAFDAGCGRGDFTLELVGMFPHFSQIIGVDFVTELIAQANHLTRKNKNIFFYQGDLLHTPFPDRYFDLVICVDVLHHIHTDDLEDAITELTRISDKYLIVEIRNKKNIYHYWYTHVVQPLLYKNLPIYTTSMDEISSLAEKNLFDLYDAQRIATSRFSCRRLVLVYVRKKKK
jgi:ubiquinone/menaquinone biosynthesis C-methylase UbiE